MKFEEHYQSVLKASLDKDLWETFEAFFSEGNPTREASLVLANQLMQMQEVRYLGNIGEGLRNIDERLQLMRT